MAGKREEQLKEITERLEQGVQELFTSERYAEYLRTMSQFHSYSFNNTLLIAMQRPDATHVAGYQAWQKKFHRQVKRGEKGIQIISPAPIRRKEERDKVDEQTGQVILKPDGEPEKEEVVHVIPQFKVATVFDVSQTVGEPLPDLGVEELTASVENYDVFMAALTQVSPAPIRFDEIAGGAKGFYNSANKEIVIQRDMSESQTLKTAVHEIAHARLHDREVMKEQGIEKDHMTREVEAESVAYTVCQHFGIDTSDYSFAYVASWSSSMEMKELRASMDTIRHTAAEFIDELTEQIQLQREQQEQYMEATEYQEVEIFEVPALYSNGRVADEDIPAGFYRYDLRGSDDDPGRPVTVQNNVVVNHAATILTMYPLKLPEQGFLYLGEELNFTGGEISVQEYRQKMEDTDISALAENMQNAVIRANENLLWEDSGERYAIYQINRDGPGDDYRFMNMDFVNQQGMTVRGSDYQLVYGGELVDGDTLEGIYQKFNLNRPQNFTGHSLSVSDVVLLNRSGVVSAHYVDSIGFQTLPDFMQERQVMWTQQLTMAPETLENGLEDRIEDEAVAEPEPMQNGEVQEAEPEAIESREEIQANDSLAAETVANEEPVTETPENVPLENTESRANESVSQEPTESSAEDSAMVNQGTVKPLYMQNGAYAREHGELDQYRESRRLNVACKDAIEKAVADNFDGMHLNPGAVKPVVDQFGEERVAYVLASTIQMKDWDGRFSPSNKEWAASVPIGEAISPFGNDRRLEWTVESHPAVLDGFVRIFREEVQEQAREQEAEKPLTADEITNFKEISREYYPHMRTAEYVFSCEVRGEPDVLTYEVSQHDDGESYSLHTKNRDIWERMSRNELEKLEFVVSREVTFAGWQKEIEQAETADDLREVNYGMMETEYLNLSDEQRERLYQMMEEKEKGFTANSLDGAEKTEEVPEKPEKQSDVSEQKKEDIPLISDRTEPAQSLHGRSMADIEETVLSYAQAEIDSMGLHDEVQLHGARVYGSRSREGLSTEGSDLDVVISYTGNISEDAFFNALHESGMSISGMPVDINPISTEKTGTLEDYLQKAEQYLDEKAAQMAEAQQAQNAEMKQEAVEPRITFYVAECMEFPILGEWHEEITSLQEAVALYEKIPAERMNGIKGIGFTLYDGSLYDGMSQEMMSAGIVDRADVNEIQQYRESPLVQKALDELEAVYPPERMEKETVQAEVREAPAHEEKAAPEPEKKPQRAASEESRGRGSVAAGGRKESVLQALRDRKAKMKEQEKASGKDQDRKTEHKKGDQSL